MTGIICLDKDSDISSFRAIKKLRAILGIEKAGHTGTLDPMATGLLVVMLGNCTRFIDFLPESDKSYTARVKLGISTNTLDITGEVLSRSSVNLSEEDIQKVAKGFIGKISQTPPMFSAIQKDGKRLYELARQGIEIERESREIEISKLEIYDFDNDEFSVDVSCSAGTYIRSLADDMGKALGCGACLKSLRRTAANGFNIEKALTLDEISKMTKEGKINDFIMPIEKALSAYPAIKVTEPQAKRFHNGGALDMDRIKTAEISKSDIYCVYSHSGQFQGLAEISDNELKPRRVFVFE